METHQFLKRAIIWIASIFACAESPAVTEPPIATDLLFNGLSLAASSANEFSVPDPIPTPSDLNPAYLTVEAPSELQLQGKVVIFQCQVKDDKALPLSCRGGISVERPNIRLKLFSGNYILAYCDDSAKHCTTYPALPQTIRLEPKMEVSVKLKEITFSDDNSERRIEYDLSDQHMVDKFFWDAFIKTKSDDQYFGKKRSICKLQLGLSGAPEIIKEFARYMLDWVEKWDKADPNNLRAFEEWKDAILKTIEIIDNKINEIKYTVEYDPVRMNYISHWDSRAIYNVEVASFSKKKSVLVFPGIYRITFRNEAGMTHVLNGYRVD